MLDEYWVAVEGFPNYKVSNYGRVVNITTDKDLKPQNNGTGRQQVFLYSYGLRIPYYVHRLVAQAFFLNYSEEVDVIHKNGDHTDNSVLNLTLRRRD